jgi:hypothetical protein
MRRRHLIAVALLCPYRPGPSPVCAGLIAQRASRVCRDRFRARRHREWATDPSIRKAYALCARSGVRALIRNNRGSSKWIRRVRRSCATRLSPSHVAGGATGAQAGFSVARGEARSAGCHGHRAQVPEGMSTRALKQLRPRIRRVVRLQPSIPRIRCRRVDRETLGAPRQACLAAARHRRGSEGGFDLQVSTRRIPYSPRARSFSKANGSRLPRLTARRGALIVGDWERGALRVPRCMPQTSIA